MKVRCLMVILLASMLTGPFNNFQATAQSNADISSAIGQILNRLTRNCERSAQVSYRSQKLISQDRHNSVYIEVTLTRSGRRGSRPFASRCSDINLQTPIATMIVENRTGVRRINLLSMPRYGSDIKNNHAIINPVSWSSTNRYLILEILDLSSPEQNDTHLILDFRNNYSPINGIICANSSAGSKFLGFLSPTVAIFECIEYGDPSYFESFDLQNRNIRRVNSAEARGRLQSYGRVSSRFQILSRP